MKLIIVYNADSGYFNKAADSLHKLVSPETYPCNICAVTHGAFGMKPEWRRFIDSLPFPVEFIHRDEYRVGRYPENVELPTIILQEDGREPHVLVDAEAVKSARSVDGLKHLVEDALQNI